MSDRLSDPRVRALGLLPLAFAAWAYASYDHGIKILWMCNLCNLLLGVGLMTANLRIIWLATLWLILGSPLWVFDIIVQNQIFPHSFATHIAAPILGIWALRGQSARPGTWILAVAFGVSVQTICRFWTPPEFNINVSHVTYKGFSGWFDDYLVYWTLTVLSLAVILFVTERVLARFIAARTPTGAEQASPVAGR